MGRRRVTGILAVALTLCLALAAPTRVPGGALQEFDNPVLTFPMGLAVSPDGGVWIASTYADQLVRFDPETRTVRRLQLEPRAHPVGIMADRRGAIWFAASGLGRVDRVEPDGTTIRQFGIPSMLTARFAIPSPWALAMDELRRQVWFTVQSDGLIARLAMDAQPIRRGFVVSELKLGSPETRPYGVAVDARGTVWVAEVGADSLARLDEQGNMNRLRLRKGSQPQNVAAAPDGTIWVTLFGGHELLRVDPVTLGLRAWPMPSGRSSSPDAVVVDRAGAVWVSEFTGNAIVRFDPLRERFTRFPLPTPRSGVRALAVEPGGRVWFVGSYSGRLGVIDPRAVPR